MVLGPGRALKASCDPASAVVSICTFINFQRCHYGIVEGIAAVLGTEDKSDGELRRREALKKMIERYACHRTCM